MVEIKFAPPERLEGALSDGLRLLTKAICEASGEESQFGLGGEFGYGVNYENEVFSMHRYCWCDGYDCPWCSYSGEEGQHFQERFRPMGAEPNPNYSGAPNFWHKASGFKVWWYKWIGRDMEANGEFDISAIISECAASLSPPHHLRNRE